MSSPSFLFTASAPASSSPFAVTTGSAATSRTANGGGDFRQAFTQMTNGQTTKGQMTDRQVGGAASSASTAPTAEDSPANILSKLVSGEVLTREDQERLQSLVEDLELTPEIQDALAAVLQDAAVNLPEMTPPSEEQSLSLKALVDLLTGGKTLPDENPVDAINLAGEELSDDSEVNPLLLFNPASPNAAASVTEEQGMDLDFVQRAAVMNGILANPSLTGQGRNSDSALQPKVADSLLTNATLVDPLMAEDAADPVASLTTKFLTGTPEATGKTEILNFSASGFMLSDADQPDDASLNQTSFVTAPSSKSTLEQLPAVPLNQAMRVQVAFGHAQWSEALTERAAWLASQQIHSAELQLDPPELGPLQVRISVHQDQAVVSFVSANPLVRDALDQSMARLRELMQEQGMQLVDAGVSDQRREGGDDAAAAEGEGSLAEDATDSASSASTVVLDTGYGVDDFV